MMRVPFLRRPAGAAVLVALLVIALAGCGSHRRTATGTGASPGASTSTGTSATPGASPSAGSGGAGTVMLGAYLDLKGMTLTQSLALRKRQLGRSLRIIHLYLNWGDSLADAARSVPAGAEPLLSWRSPQLYSSITNGSQDAQILRQARALAGVGRPVMLMWAWEMNGSWFPWSGVKNPTRTAGFIAAWRHLHDLFGTAGARNVSWVWSPNYYSMPAQPWNTMDHYYPGDAYVDWVGVSGYSYGRQLPDFLFGPTCRMYGQHKPIMIAETGIAETGGHTKPDWIRLLQGWIIAHPEVRALVWFDTDTFNGTNWRVDTSAAAVAAYQAMANDPHFSG
jgi:hypothetical protein